MEEFLKNPQFNKINWRDEAIKDKICKEKADLSNVENLKK